MLSPKIEVWSQLLKEYIRKGNIFILVSIPIFTGLTIIIGGTIIAQEIFPNIPPLTLSTIFIFFGGIIASISGLIQIYRREMPGIYMGSVIHGWYPVVTGILWVAFCWIIILGILVFTIIDISHN